MVFGCLLFQLFTPAIRQPSLSTRLACAPFRPHNPINVIRILSGNWYRAIRGSEQVYEESRFVGRFDEPAAAIFINALVIKKKNESTMSDAYPINWNCTRKNAKKYFHLGVCIYIRRRGISRAITRYLNDN